MHLTVVICTWNRAPLLRRTLEGLRALQVPAGLEWDVLVVDNASTDETPRVLADFAGLLPLRALHEPRPGVSHARNTAVGEVRGDVIVWTDDDVLVAPDWLAAYADAARAHPGAVFFGGPIEPLFEGDPPPYLAAALRAAPYAYAALDHGPEPVALVPEPRRWAFTANMAIRTAAQRRYAYDPTLGRNKSALVGGEDTTLIRQIWNDGGHGQWVPRARVRHVIPAERQTVAFLRRYFRGKGAQIAIAEPEFGDRMLLGVPRSALRSAVTNELRFRLHRLGRPPEVWLGDLQRAAQAWGYIGQARRQQQHAARD